MTGQKRADQGGPVDSQVQRLAQGSVVKGGTVDVDSNILQNRGVHILKAGVAGGGDGIRTGEICSEQLDVMGGELIEQRIPILCGGEKDLLDRQCSAVPPVGIDRQAAAGLSGGKLVGAGPDGREGGLRAGLDDGNIQQGREGGVGTGEDHRQSAAASGDIGDLIKPGPVAVGIHGPAQCGCRVSSGECGTIRKQNTAAEGEGVGICGRVILVRRTQPRLGRQRFIQPKETLVEQGPYGLLHPVRTGDRVQRLIGFIRQSKIVRQDHPGVFGLFLLGILRWLQTADRPAVFASGQ